MIKKEKYVVYAVIVKGYSTPAKKRILLAITVYEYFSLLVTTILSFYDNIIKVETTETSLCEAHYFHLC